MKMKIDKVAPGCFLVDVKGRTFLFGCPSEVTKMLMVQNKQMPSTIILSRDGYRGGVIQTNVEFPFLNFLFIVGGFFRGEKLRIVAEEEQLPRVRDNLQLGLVIPDRKTLLDWGISNEVINAQQKITDHFALKRKDGSPAQIEDMAELIPFDRDGHVVLDGVEIRTSARNVFTITCGSESMPVDLNFFGYQPPPIRVETCQINLKRSAFGAIALSKCTSGFDKTGYTTGFLLLVNSQPIQVDGVPWTKEHLRALGFHPGEIVANIISHVHEDHVSIVEAIINGMKIHLITTREIFFCFARKIANTIGWTEQQVRDMIIFHEVTPGVPFHWYGATFNFFRSVHTIFCVGFEVEFGGKKIVYSGDTAWGSILKKLFDGGVISQQQFEAVDRIPRIDADLTIMDGAGDKLIHPDPEELNQLPMGRKEKIFLTHRSSLPEGITGLRTICPGQQWELIPAKTWDVGDINAVIGSPIISGLDRKWINAILTAGEIADVTPGQVILCEGSPGQNFYVVLSGALSVITNEEEVAKLGTGDFFGEISIMHGVVCTATIEVISGGRILGIPKKLFMEMVASTELGEKLRKIHRLRPVLLKCGWMKDLPPQVVNRIIGTTEERHYTVGEEVVKQGEFGSEMYVLRTGRVQILIEPNGYVAKSIATLYPGQFFGEMALLGNGKRAATAIAETDVTVLVIKKADFESLVKEVPALYYSIGTLAEERAKEL